jgi:hypothetical protein
MPEWFDKEYRSIQEAQGALREKTAVLWRKLYEQQASCKHEYKDDVNKLFGKHKQCTICNKVEV